MKPALITLLLLLLAGCHNERQQLGQALSGQPPVMTGSLIGRWTMADLNGGGPVAGGVLEFSAGSLTGTAGCNRLMGSWQENGATLTVGPLAATRMACAPAAMNQEQRVMALFALPLTVKHDGTGGVSLIAADGRRLRLAPAVP